MQIRAANKKDEPFIRKLVFDGLAENGFKPDPEGLDADLKNVEKSYFWYDGLCIVAEEEGVIVGVLAARSSDACENVLDLRRLFVCPEKRRLGIARELFKTMLFFAGNSSYKKIVVSDRASSGKNFQAIAERLGFASGELALKL